MFLWLVLLLFITTTVVSFGFSIVYYIVYFASFYLTHFSTPDKSRAGNQKQLKKFKIDVQEYEAKYLEEEFTIKNGDHSFLVSRLCGVRKPIGNIIMVHGLTNGRKSLYKEAEMYLDFGYQVFLFDQRNADSNTADYLSYGLLESRDLHQVIDTLNRTYNDLPLHVWGVSYGSATAIIALGQAQKNVKSLVLDSPVSDFRIIFGRMIQEHTQLPNFLIQFLKTLVRFYVRWVYDFDLNRAAPVEFISNIEIPVLIISQAKDEITPEFMARALYQAKSKGPVYIENAANAAHTGFFVMENKRYRKIISNFMKSLK